ncbi:hypothetical protein JTB14_006159 [Gonioctena quinquepunctata]|nr:hypothetical protein JTB14_006159 [Gonioctena quinquepunctata]
MTKISKLLPYSEEEKRAILKHHNFSDIEFNELAEQLREWSIKSPLPVEHITNNALKSALLNCKMSPEKVKKTLEGYFRIRTILSDFFDRFLPNTEDYLLSKSLAKCAVMPKLAPDLCRITIFRMDDPNGKATDGLEYVLVAIMGIELRIRSDDFFYSNILVIDFQNFDLQTLMKFTPTVNQKLVNLMLAINLRLKNIHLVNLPPVLDRLMILMKLVLPTKFFNKVCTHADYESLYEYIPKEYLPTNYNGTEPSIEQIHDDWCKELENREEDFKKLLSAKCHDLVGRRIAHNQQFGVEGSFRKLTLD